MFGPSLLVNPVYMYKATNRTLYLPEWQGWYDLYSGKYYEGGKEIIADAPYEQMPVFVKAGSIIPTDLNCNTLLKNPPILSHYLSIPVKTLLLLYMKMKISTTTMKKAPLLKSFLPMIMKQAH